MKYKLCKYKNDKYIGAEFFSNKDDAIDKAKELSDIGYYCCVLDLTGSKPQITRIYANG